MRWGCLASEDEVEVEVEDSVWTWRENV